MDLKLSNSVANFAVKFYNELEKNKTTICSPLSVEIALAMLSLGCKNQSRAELMTALDVPDDDALRISFSSLTSTLKSVRGVTLTIANKIYVIKNSELKPQIQKDAEEVFESSVEQLDFTDSKAAANTINEWVARKTNFLIKDIVSPAILHWVSSVIVNAIYFKGDWKIPFIKKLTKNKTFYVDERTTIEVPQMCAKGYFKYSVCPELKARLLQMNYKGGDANMIIVLPDDIEGLNYVLQLLKDGYDLLADLAALKDTKLDVWIPKFKVETTIDLNKVLPKLGIKSIFSRVTSEIYMLASNERLYVSTAVQKAFIVVDETGTEAAASTAIMKRVIKRAKSNPVFNADRPFLYLLTARNILLFIGVYEGREYAQATYT
ncbi:antitrypsin-like [Choristoneura fumiferana]|uniref:antitrypsin-like n=2 Tax=Choristoneura fumiferana TaxID=7141 RepID=UPI003D15C2FB